MNNNYSDFYVNLLGSDGTTVNIPGTWSSGYFANDTWSGTVNIPENFPDGQTKIAVRAKRFSAAGLDEYYQDLDLIGTGGPALNTVDRSVDYFRTLLASIVGHGFDLIPQSIIANATKFTPSTFALDQIKRYTAPYARHVALCPPLTRRASAPQARPALLKLARLAGNGEEDLLCGVRRAAASRYAYAPRTARYTASYPREAARAGTVAPAQGLPQEKRYAASYARVAVGGRSSGGQLPRSPAGDFFFSPARKEIINKRIVKMMAAKAVKRILPGALHIELPIPFSAFVVAAPRRRFSCG